MTTHEPIRATIVKKGRCREDGYTEPYALLDDGRTMPMGWNRSGPIFEVGTSGTARYVAMPSAGLWEFTADEPPMFMPDRQGEQCTKGVGTNG